MIKIDQCLLDSVSKQAKESPRQRKNYNFHKTCTDTLQRLLNAIEPYSYIQPHKHQDPDKREVFFMLRGRLLIVEFDDAGHITDSVILDSTEGPLVAEIRERVFHTIMALTPGTIIYEVKDGPYDPGDDKKFAPWAPREGEQGIPEYQMKIFRQVGIPDR